MRQGVICMLIAALVLQLAGGVVAGGADEIMPMPLCGAVAGDPVVKQDLFQKPCLGKALQIPVHGGKGKPGIQRRNSLADFLGGFWRLGFAKNAKNRLTLFGIFQLFLHQNAPLPVDIPILSQFFLKSNAKT